MTLIANAHYVSLPARFRAFRQQLGLSQAEFGNRLELDQTGVSAIEKGKQDITIRTLYRLIDLDCNPSWLLLAEGPMLKSNVETPGATVEVRVRGDKTEYIVRV